MSNIDKQLIRDDIAIRKSMPGFGIRTDHNLARLKAIQETQRSFCLEVVEALMDELEAKDSELQEYRKAASHPVGLFAKRNGTWLELCQGDTFEHPDGVLLYAAQPAPASVPDYPETLPCPVMLEPGLRFGKGVPTKTMLGALQRRAEYYAELEAMTPEQRAEHEAGMKEFAAMLQGAEPVTTAYKLPFEQWLSQQTVTIDVECGCVMTEVFFHWLRVAYEAGNSPVIPDCSCLTCRPVTFTDSRFVVCPECGNKRCPHANDHRNACTGSNEPGQEGGAYPAAPQQEVK